MKQSLIVRTPWALCIYLHLDPRTMCMASRKTKLPVSIYTKHYRNPWVSVAMFCLLIWPVGLINFPCDLCDVVVFMCGYRSRDTHLSRVLAYWWFYTRVRWADVIIKVSVEISRNIAILYYTPRIQFEFTAVSNCIRSTNAETQIVWQSKVNTMTADYSDLRTLK